MKQLLLIVSLSLIGLEKEAKLQRAPEKVARMEKQAALEQQAEELVRNEQAARTAELKAKSWGEVGFTEEAIDKFVAHRYTIWILGGLLILAGPALMRKRYEY